MPGGCYCLTPLYDILSTYPVQGHGANRLDPYKVKLAMSVKGKNRHYHLHDIHRWHWITLAESLGLTHAPDMIDDLVACARRSLRLSLYFGYWPPRTGMQKISVSGLCRADATV